MMNYSKSCISIILRGYSKLVADHDSFHRVEASSLNTLRWNSGSFCLSGCFCCLTAPCWSNPHIASLFSICRRARQRQQTARQHRQPEAECNLQRLHSPLSAAVPVCQADVLGHLWPWCWTPAVNQAWNAFSSHTSIVRSQTESAARCSQTEPWKKPGRFLLCTWWRSGLFGPR